MRPLFFAILVLMGTGAAANSNELTPHDSSLEAYRNCLSVLDDSEHVSRAPLVVIVGGTQARKPGIYSLAPGGILYFHECAVSGASLTFPRKLSASQQDYSPPPGVGFRVVNSKLKPPFSPEAWHFESAISSLSSNAVCNGVRVRDSKAMDLIRARIQKLAAARVTAGDRALTENMRRDAIASLTRRQRVARPDSGSVHVYHFTPAQVDAEAVVLLEAKKQPLSSCRETLKTIKPAPAPEETRLASDLEQLLMTLNKAEAPLRVSIVGGGAGPAATTVHMAQ